MNARIGISVRSMTQRIATIGLAAGIVAPCHGLEPAGQAPDISLAGSGDRWASTGSLIVAREKHTATLLADGRVLVAGGCTSSPVATAELYDPGAGTWTLTGSLRQPRCEHTATLLPDGQVLVAGGDDGRGTAELYDPAAGAWRLTGAMHESRAAHTATLLGTGQVLVAGGYTHPGKGAELYDPVTGTWDSAGRLITPRWNHTATLLPDGTVLVAGGTNDPFHEYDLGDAEIYDPVAGTWRGAIWIDASGEGHAAAPLPSGNVLITSGAPLAPWSAAVPTQVYDAGMRAVTRAADPATPRYWPTATRLADGNVLIAGGYRYLHSATLETAEVGSGELYDTARGTWVAAGELLTPRSGHTATLLRDGRVLVVGGRSPAGWLPGRALASAELYTGVAPGTVGPGFSGVWYDPAQDGHYLIVQVLSDNRFLAGWLTFAPDGRRQAWFGGVGTYNGNTAIVNDVYQTTGGRWIPDHDPARIAVKPWGSLTFTFTDCDHGRVDFNSVAGYGSDSMNLTRLTQPAGLACP